MPWPCGAEAAKVSSCVQSLSRAACRDVVRESISFFAVAVSSCASEMRPTCTRAARNKVNEGRARVRKGEEAKRADGIGRHACV